MSKPISGKRLAIFEAEAEIAWQKAIKQFQDDFPLSDEQCRLMIKLMMVSDSFIAGQIFAAALMKLHVAIGRQTGKMLTDDDLQEAKDLMNQRNRN